MEIIESWSSFDPRELDEEFDSESVASTHEDHRGAHDDPEQ